MKKLLALLALVLALVSLSALAADADTETTLWPACDPETGLWGYIDAQGAWGIAPQYTQAYHFHDGCAIVNMVEHAHADTSTQGIIDENGAFLLEPEYDLFCEHDFAYSPGDIFFVMDEEGRMGWFNVPNTYFSGVHWDECFAAFETPYVMVSEDYQTIGLADRATGEIVVPMEYSYTGLYDWAIEDGFIVAQRDGTDGCELIEIGVGPVTLPEGVYLDYVVEVSDGLVVYTNEEGLYGYIDTAGEIVIPAQFDSAHEFRSGYAEVGLLEEVRTSAIIDHSGNVVLSGLEVYYGMRAGALFVEWPDDTWGLAEPDGTIRCRHTLQEGACDVWLYEFTADGPIWLEYALSDWEYTWGLMSREGELLGEPRWQSASRGGDMVAVCEGGAWGYVDLWGNTVLPFTYAWAEAFDGALARVQFDESTQGYINRSGEVVYQWPSPGDEW